MQENDFQLTPGIPVFSFDFSIIDAFSATFNSRNQFNILTQNRLKGTQKGPKPLILIFAHKKALLEIIQRAS